MRSSTDRLDDISESCQAILRHAPQDRTLLDADEVLQAAIVRWTEIIGEAANHVGDELRNRHPEVPWRQITGMRNRIVHSYWEVDTDILWNVANVEIPRPAEQVRKIRDELEPRDG